MFRSVFPANNATHVYTLVSDYVNLIGRPRSIFQFPLMDMIVDPAHRENFNFLPFSQLILSPDTPITRPGVLNMRCIPSSVHSFVIIIMMRIMTVINHQSSSSSSSSPHSVLLLCRADVCPQRFFGWVFTNTHCL